MDESIAREPVPTPVGAPTTSGWSEPSTVHAANGTPDRAHLVDELERLVRLRDAGALTDVEFASAKARLLG